MTLVYPDYYKDFKCINSACRHNCCIGWEIDIDEDTAEKYKAVGGALGKRLKKNISYDGMPHFILDKNERCPFLNTQNLCDIITELGEEHLCTICQKHPRFENELPCRTEIGIGMACEEAARIILSKRSPALLLGKNETDDEIIILRDKVITVLQNREETIPERISNMLTLCGTFPVQKSIPEWADIFLGCERLDEAWTDMLTLLQKERDFAAFDAHMAKRQSEYEQLLVYFIYRHMANAPDMPEAAARATLAAVAYTVIHALGAALYEESGEFTLSDQVELCRMFSSEIEYSDENIYTLLDEM